MRLGPQMLKELLEKVCKKSKEVANEDTKEVMKTVALLFAGYILFFISKLFCALFLRP